MYKDLIDQLRTTKSRSKRKLLDDAANAIDRLANTTQRVANAETRWISAEERLPTRADTGGTDIVLAIAKGESKVQPWFWDIVVRYPQEFTCWMPLPEPPNEE